MIASPSTPLPPAPQVRADNAGPTHPDSVSSSERGAAFAATLDRQVKRSGEAAEAAAPDGATTGAVGATADATGPVPAIDTQAASRVPMEESPDAIGAALAEIAMVMMAGQQLQQVPNQPARVEVDEQASLGASAALPMDEASRTAMSLPDSPDEVLTPEPAELNPIPPLAAAAPVLPDRSAADSTTGQARGTPEPSSPKPVVATDAGVELRDVKPQRPSKSAPDRTLVTESPATPGLIAETGRPNPQPSIDVAVGESNKPERLTVDLKSIAATRTTVVQSVRVSADADQPEDAGLSFGPSLISLTQRLPSKPAASLPTTGTKPAPEPGDAVKSLFAELGFSLDTSGDVEVSPPTIDIAIDAEGPATLEAMADVGSAPSTMPQMVAGQVSLESRSTEPAKPAFSIPTPVGHEAWPENLGETLVSLNRASLESAELKLNPNHLGPLDVRVRLGEDGSVAVNFTSAHAPVREAIQAASAQLREMLATQEIRLGELSISSPPTGSSGDASSSSFSAFQQWSGRDGAGTQSGLKGAATASLEEGGEVGVTDRGKAKNSGALSLYA